MEQIVEFHDSRIARIEVLEDCISIVFSHAYVYAKGRGWSQNATITVREGVLIEEASSYPVIISEGELLMPAMEYCDLLEVPFSQRGRCELKLVLTNGEKITVTGSDPQMVLHGEREFIEHIDMP